MAQKKSSPGIGPGARKIACADNERDLPSTAAELKPADQTDGVELATEFLRTCRPTDRRAPASANTISCLLETAHIQTGRQSRVTPGDVVAAARALGLIVEINNADAGIGIHKADTGRLSGWLHLLSMKSPRQRMKEVNKGVPWGRR